jgi:ABC-type multidrug transport system permease subunit
MKMAALILGIIFLILAIVYFVIPAGSLPGFLPGFEAGSALRRSSSPSCCS